MLLNKIAYIDPETPCRIGFSFEIIMSYSEIVRVIDVGCPLNRVFFLILALYLGIKMLAFSVSQGISVKEKISLLICKCVINVLCCTSTIRTLGCLDSGAVFFMDPK